MYMGFRKIFYLFVSSVLISFILFPSFLFAKARPVHKQTVIAFAADIDQEKPQPLWNTILKLKPDIFLFLGDNVYLDTADETVMRNKYAKLAQNSGFAKFIAAQIPIVSTWDDHDYGLDDAGMEFAQKEISKKVFLDFFKDPIDSARRKRAGIYDSKIFGEPGRRVQVIALDLRTFRSSLKKSARGGNLPNSQASATVLGPEQWLWLREELKKPAEVRIIMSSIQVITRDNGWGNWMNFPLERRKLFNTIKDTGANGVVFVSGDRHFAELSNMNGGIGYPLYDLTTGSFNKAPKQFTEEKNMYRLVKPYSSESFGLITIEWPTEKKATWITLEARDLQNRPVVSARLPLSLLKQGVLPYRR